jgi:hypothetical protein
MGALVGLWQVSWNPLKYDPAREKGRGVMWDTMRYMTATFAITYCLLCQVVLSVGPTILDLDPYCSGCRCFSLYSISNVSATGNFLGFIVLLFFSNHIYPRIFLLLPKSMPFFGRYALDLQRRNLSNFLDI